MAQVAPQVPFPGCERLSTAAAAYAASQPSSSYYEDLISAHRAAGLVLDVLPTLFLLPEVACVLREKDFTFTGQG